MLSQRNVKKRIFCLLLHERLRSTCCRCHVRLMILSCVSYCSHLCVCKRKYFLLLDLSHVLKPFTQRKGFSLQLSQRFCPGALPSPQPNTLRSADNLPLPPFGQPAKKTRFQCFDVKPLYLLPLPVSTLC